MHFIRYSVHIKENYNMKKLILLSFFLISATAFSDDSTKTSSNPGNNSRSDYKGEANIGVGYNFLITGATNKDNVIDKSGISFDLAAYLKLGILSLGVETGYVTMRSSIS